MSGTINLLGPSSSPPGPPITRVDQLNAPINSALAVKANQTDLASLTARVAALEAAAGGVAPGAVTGLTAGTATATTQPLSWTAPSTGTAPIVYLVEYRPTGSGSYTTFASGVGGTSSTVTGLTASTGYDYRVTPSNATGSGTAATLTDAVTASASATVPAAPTITLTPGSGQVSIAWTDGSNGGASITSHKLYRGASGLETLLGTITGASPYVDSSVTNGTLYYYKLSAVNSVGEGALSAEQSATPASALYARFAQDTATAGTSGTAAALFTSMTQVTSPTTDRNGTMTTTADPTRYTWVAVLASAAGSGMHFFDGTGYGGFNGAASSSIYSGPDADPTTIHQTYTDGSSNVWNLYRSSGHSVTLTFTLS